MPTKKATPEKPEEVTPERRILVFQDKKAFVITVPQDAKTTFGPWVPPGMRSDRFGAPGDAMGTLRVYGRTEKHILGVFSGVTGFRDLSLGYVDVEPGILGAHKEEEVEELATKPAKPRVFPLSDSGPLPLPPATMVSGTGYKRTDKLFIPREKDPDEL